MALENYDSLPEDHSLVERYHPKFIARGGNRLVYEVAGHPEVVIKASTYTIKDVLSENASSGQPLDVLSPEMKSKIDEEVVIKNQQIRELRQYFGKEHAVAERMYRLQVPVTDALIGEIYTNDWQGRTAPALPAGSGEVWSTVTVQRKVEAIQDPGHLSLHFGPFREDGEVAPEEQAKVKEISALAGEDTEFSQALRDFVDKALSFTKSTGNILALAGVDNVVFAKENGKWNYLLVDALSVNNERVFQEARAIMQKSIQGEDLSDHEKTLLNKAINYARVMNSLASVAGIPERLELAGNRG